MSLQFILDSQELFQKSVNPDFDAMTSKEHSQYLHEQGYFLIEETTEMLRELPFHKSWKDYTGWTVEKRQEQEALTKEEAIDALHFLANIFVALGMNESEIVAMYKKKNRLNYKRQSVPELGYIGGN